ncbi:alpha/beta fold hydrolase [Bacillus sp. DJP31]|uniref:alpha/beta fold hydrolase n=1 Tax=Bacillus sp. DJP31 TaxID=3409789 RepID=UPI003BB5AE26
MYTTINGCKLYYEIQGKEDGEPIFFIHGGPGLGDCRGDIKAFLSLGDQYKLVFLDMRGSGRSEDVPPYSHKQWTADIEGLRLFLGLGKINILGGSYGGFLTLEYVIRYPENVSRVLLRDTAPSNNYNDLSMEKALNSQLPGIDEDMLDRLFHGRVKSDEEFREMFAAILPLYTVVVDEEANKKRLDDMYFHYETHNYAFSVNKQSYDLLDQLQTIKVPVLVTVGREDWVTPVVCSEDIAREIENSTFVIFEKSGHSPHLEENEAYLKLVRTFLMD